MTFWQCFGLAESEAREALAHWWPANASRVAFDPLGQPLPTVAVCHTCELDRVRRIVFGRPGDVADEVTRDLPAVAGGLGIADDAEADFVAEVTLGGVTLALWCEDDGMLDAWHARAALHARLSGECGEIGRRVIRFGSEVTTLGALEDAAAAFVRRLPGLATLWEHAPAAVAV
jgi:hypothetical protein